MGSKLKLPLIAVALLSVFAFQNCSDAEMSFKEVPSTLSVGDSSVDDTRPPITDPGTTTPSNVKLKFRVTQCKAGDLCTVYLSLTETPKQKVQFEFATDDAAYGQGRATAQPHVDYLPYPSTTVTLTGPTEVPIKIQTLKRPNKIEAYTVDIPVTMSNCRYADNTMFSCSSLQK